MTEQPQWPKPMPVPTPTSQPYWDALAEHKVRIQYCATCEEYVFYPRSNCPGCLGRELEWRELSGAGTLYTFTISRRPTAPPFADDVPQLLAVVELDEGPRMTSTLVNVEEDQIQIGMRLRPVFEDHPDGGATLLRYEPAG